MINCIVIQDDIFQLENRMHKKCSSPPLFTLSFIDTPDNLEDKTRGIKSYFKNICTLKNIILLIFRTEFIYNEKNLFLWLHLRYYL